MKHLERKQDTQRKIQLGGLIKKSGLADESTAVLLGLLLEAREHLDGEKAHLFHARWRLKGDFALTDEKIRNQD